MPPDIIACVLLMLLAFAVIVAVGYIGSAGNCWANTLFKSRLADAQQLLAPMQGATAAMFLLSEHGCADVVVRERNSTTGTYIVSARTVTLNSALYHGNKVGAVAIAAHEVGHAIQYKSWWCRPMQLLCTVMQWGYVYALVFLVSGNVAVFWHRPACALLHDLAVTVFVTTMLVRISALWPEIDATRRARRMLRKYKLLTTDADMLAADKLLAAAGLTHAFAAVAALTRLNVFDGN